MIDPAAKSPAPQPKGQLVEEPARVASSSLDHHRGAERLYEAIRASCQPPADFAEQLRSALAAALALLAAEPDLARLLCLEPYLGGDELLESQRVWEARLAAQLRQAAGASQRAATHPPFLEPLLIGGVCWQLSARAQAGQAEQLDQLLPDLLEFLLAYYVDPKERVRTLAELRSAKRGSHPGRPVTGSGRAPNLPGSSAALHKTELPTCRRTLTPIPPPETADELGTAGL